MTPGLIGCVLGVLSLTFWAVLPSIAMWSWVSAGVLALTWVGLRISPRGQPLAWMVLGCVLGVGHAVSSAHSDLARRIGPACELKPLAVSGVIEGLPMPAQPKGWRVIFRVEADSAQSCVMPGQRWQLRLPVTEMPLPGERWQVTARLRQIHGVANPGGFDVERFAHHQGWHARGSVSQAERLAAAPEHPDVWRSRIRTHLLAAFPDQTLGTGLLLAMLIGDSVGLTASTREALAQGGISHLLVISGTHITLVALMAAALARPLLGRWPTLIRRIPRDRAAGFVAWCVAVGYSLLAGWTVPTQRSIIMFTVWVLAQWLPGKLSGFRCWLLALVLVLVWHPLSILSESLWLSFGAMAALMVAGVQVGRELPWRALWRVQCWVGLLLLPVSLVLFGRVSWVGFLLNLVAIPWINLLMLPLALLGLVLLPVSTLLSHGCWQLSMAGLELLWHVNAWVIAWPGAFTDVQLSGAGIWAVLVAVVLTLWPQGRAIRLLVLPAVFTLATLQAATAPYLLQIAQLDVGQGTAVLVRTATKNLLIDTGPPIGVDADTGQRVIKPALSWLGVTALDELMISHDDLDHTGGVAGVLQALPVRQLRGARPSTATLPPDLPVVPCRAGQQWQWDGVQFDVLWPRPADASRPKNDQSCVLRVTAGDFSWLFTGDLEARGELHLALDHPLAPIQSDVLVLGHHGSHSSTRPLFLERVTPQAAWVSAGYLSRYHHPHHTVLARVQAMGVPLWRSDVEGMIVLTVNAAGTAWHTTSWRGQRRAYWAHDRQPGNATPLGRTAVIP